MILDEILSSTRNRIEEAKLRIPYRQLVIAGTDARKPHDVLARLKGSPHFIAEIKPSSPSMGTIKKNVDVLGIAKSYLAGGASVLSVLTEPHFFRGDTHYLTSIREAFPSALLLQKDFIVEEYQILQARLLGADLILLIVSALEQEALRRLYGFATSLGLTVLVEVHDAREMDRAAALGAKLIGVNNRNLKTMQVSLDVSRDLVTRAPKGAFLVSESGISTGAEVKQLSSMGYRGFLVGTSLMKQSDPGLALRTLIGEAT